MSQQQTQDQSQDSAIHVLVIGNDAKENAVVIEALQHHGTPLQVVVSNLMPRNISLPELTTEVLQHVAAGAELSSCTGTIRDHASLVRLAGNVQSVCQLNDYRNGISIKPVNVKSDSDAEAEARAKAAADAADAAAAEAAEAAKVEADAKAAADAAEAEANAKAAADAAAAEKAAAAAKAAADAEAAAKSTKNGKK